MTIEIKNIKTINLKKIGKSSTLEFGFIFKNSKLLICLFSESQSKNIEITGQKLSTKRDEVFS